MPEVRKLVTILFADVTGSTALGEALDPEDVRALMGHYYQHARHVIADHGGTLEKFIGDAVMAVFGLPQAHGNDAERALAAALALRQAIADDRMLAERLLLRIGVNSGEVVSTRDPSAGDFLVTGDAVNVAARLEQVAAPGEILASERTAAAARASFLFAAERTITVKGKSRPLRVCPLARQRPARQIGRPPLVGRKPDLAQLALLRDRALEERRPQLVSIVAPAGTGKTRLLEEFLARLDPAADFHVATARCLPYGQTLTYWPLRGLLEELLGGAFTSESVVAAFAAGGLAQDDADRLAGMVLASLGIESERGQAQPERETIFSAWRLLIEALARQAPRIIVFEDLHWAGESLLDLVEHLMQLRTQAALLIVATSRPELLDHRPTWGGGRRSFTALALEPLSDALTRTLVGKLAKQMPEATSEQIVERSGGNPFFAIELARAAAGRGLAGSATAPDGTKETLPLLPDTVQEALQEQLDLLSTPERAVLQAASVAGRAFRPATLQAALDASAPDKISAALDGLVARDLIAPAEGGAYTFRHILIRDVAYGTLARAERIRLHVAVADGLEQFAASRVDEFVELIAYHYREAAQLARQSAVPRDAPVEAARAVYFLEHAGEVAGRTGALIEARAHLESAIALAPEAEHARLYEKLGDCMQLGDTAIHAYRTAFERWRSTEAREPLVGARILRKLLIMYLRWPATWTNRPDDSELAALRAEALRLAEASGDEHEFWHVRVADGFWPNWRVNITPQEADSGRRMFLAAAAHFEERRDWIAFSEALDGYTVLSSMIGAHEDAMKASRRRLSTPEVPATERGDAVNMLASAHLQSGDYDRCIATIQEALAQLRPGDPVILLGKGPLWAVGAAGISGRWSELDWLLPTLQKGWEQAQNDRGMAYLAVGYFVALHIALAHEDPIAVNAAVFMLEQLLTPQWMTGSRALLAAYRMDDPLQIGLGASQEVWPYLRMEEFRCVSAMTLMFLSERSVRAADALLSLARAQGEVEKTDFMVPSVAVAEAVAADDNVGLAAAIEEAEAHGLLPHAARMHIVLAQRTGDRAPLERARPVLERLGDRQFLRRLEQVQAALK